MGIRLGEPGTGRPVPALAYRELGEEQMAAQEREERRLFYVAMTRARERLILSGAAKLDDWDKERSPIGWIAPAIIADAAVAPTYVVGSEPEIDDRVLGGGEEDRPRPDSGAAEAPAIAPGRAADAPAVAAGLRPSPCWR